MLFQPVSFRCSKQRYVFAMFLKLTIRNIVLNGAVGADLHVPFPIAIRASYGTYFGYFCVASRAILALFWFGIQSAYGGECVTPVSDDFMKRMYSPNYWGLFQIISAIWPSYRDLPNHLPASAAITTQGMISYLVYHVLQAPFLFIPTHRLHYMFIFKSALVPPMALAMVIWISVKAGGGSDLFHAPPTVHGSERAWLWLMNMTSITGTYLEDNLHLIQYLGPCVKIFADSE